MQDTAAQQAEEVAAAFEAGRTSAASAGASSAAAERDPVKAELARLDAEFAAARADLAAAQADRAELARECDRQRTYIEVRLTAVRGGRQCPRE